MDNTVRKAFLDTLLTNDGEIKYTLISENPEYIQKEGGEDGELIEVREYVFSRSEGPNLTVRM